MTDQMEAHGHSNLIYLSIMLVHSFLCILTFCVFEFFLLFLLKCNFAVFYVYFFEYLEWRLDNVIFNWWKINDSNWSLRRGKKKEIYSRFMFILFINTLWITECAVMRAHYINGIFDGNSRRVIQKLTLHANFIIYISLLLGYELSSVFVVLFHLSDAAATVVVVVAMIIIIWSFVFS